MKKLTVFALMVSLGLSHTAFGGIEKSESPDNPNGVQINIHSDLDVYGVQFDLSYDTNTLSLTEEDIVPLVNGFDKVWAKVNDAEGTAKVLMFSMSGATIMQEGVSSIIDIKFEGDIPTGEANISISNLILAGVNGMAIECEKDATFDLDFGMPLETSLNANYPNPFNPSTTIPFELAKSGYLTLKVYDMNGSLVKTLASNYRDAGSYEVVWNGLNNDGQQVSSGQYMLQMSTPGYSNTLQMTFIK